MDAQPQQGYRRVSWDGGRLGVTKSIKRVNHGTIMVYICGIVGLKRRTLVVKIDTHCESGSFDMGAFVALSHSG